MINKLISASGITMKVIVVAMWLSYSISWVLSIGKVGGVKKRV